MADSEIEVIHPEFLDRDKFNASKIRKMIIQDNSWENFVPKAVVNVIKEINGVQRLKIISNPSAPIDNVIIKILVLLVLKSSIILLRSLIISSTAFLFSLILTVLIIACSYFVRPFLTDPQIIKETLTVG